MRRSDFVQPLCALQRWHKRIRSSKRDDSRLWLMDGFRTSEVLRCRFRKVGCVWWILWVCIWIVSGGSLPTTLRGDRLFLFLLLLISDTLGQWCRWIQAWTVHGYGYLQMATRCVYVLIHCLLWTAKIWSTFLSVMCVYVCVLVFAFSAGPRACIGQRFAMAESICILASVVRRYEILLPTDVLGLSVKEQEDILTEWKILATLIPTSARVKFRRR